MSRRYLSVKGGTSERCYRTRRGRTDEQRYAIISPYFDGRIKMNGPYPEITNIIFGQIIFQNFHQFKAFVGLLDCRTIGLSDCRTIGLSDYSYGPSQNTAVAPFFPDARTFHNMYKLQKHVLLRHQSYLIVFMGNKNLRLWQIMPL
jgi:hypothetical protein